MNTVKRFSGILRIAAVLFGIAIINSFGHAAVYVHHDLGNDTTGDGSIGAPYYSVTKALMEINETTPASNRIILAEGIWTTNSDPILDITNTVGTESEPIVITSWSNRSSFINPAGGTVMYIQDIKNDTNYISSIKISNLVFDGGDNTVYIRSYYLEEKILNLEIKNCDIKSSYRNCMFVMWASNAIIRESFFHGATKVVLESDTGMGIFCMNNNMKIIKNTFYSNEYSGIDLKGNNILVQSNTIFDNGSSGMWIWNCSSNIIRDNAIYNNVGGMFIFSGGYSSIINNTIYSNDWTGIYTQLHDNAEVISNTIIGNSLDGIMCCDSSVNQIIARNYIYENERGITTLCYSG